MSRVASRIGSMKQHQKITAIMLVLLLSMVILAGCSGSNAPASGTKPQSSPQGGEASQDSSKSPEAAEPVKLRMAAWSNAVPHLLSVLASEAGFYAEEGLNVELTPNNSNPENLTALVTDKLDATSAGATAVLNYIDEGNDIVIIGGQMTEGAALFALPERADEFKELTQEALQGKRIGITRLQSGDIALRVYLQEQGIDLSTIEFVELDSCPTIIEAIKNGSVDLGSVFMTFRQTAEQQGLAVVKHIDELFPGFLCCRLVTTQEKLDADRATFVKLVRANIKAYRLYKTDEAKTLEIAKKFILVDDQIIRQQIYDYGHLGITPNPALSDVKKFFKGMVDVKYAKGNVAIEDHTDTSLFRDALDSLIAENPDDTVYLELRDIYEATN
ncbi:MAG: ABC transporter substrate-binding protein [Clostridiales bacterium]